MSTVVFHAEGVLPSFGADATLTPLASDGSGFSAVEKAVACGRFSRFVNLCAAGRGAPASHGPCAADVAAWLERAGVPHFGGVPSKQLDYTPVDARVSAFYSELKVAPFRVVTSANATPDAALAGLRYPMRLSQLSLVGAGRHLSDGGFLVGDVEEANVALDRLRPRAAKVLIEETLPNGCAGIDVLILGNTSPSSPTSTRPAAPGATVAVLAAKTGIPVDVATAAANEEFVAQCKEFFKTFCGGCGWCLVRFGWAPEAPPPAAGDDSPALKPSEPRLFFMDASPNCNVFGALAGDMAGRADQKAAAAILADHGVSPADFVDRITAPLISKAWGLSFDPEKQGFFLVATRDIRKGEVVFADEGTPMPIVTKAYVERHWSAADRETFTRYAWPMDNDGHLYGIWHDDPRTWRPINHSCNPSLEFMAPHSLDHGARRDIKKGESLTLDYTTFCDFTMAPFDCFCGEPTCRKRIMPDAAVLATFGDRAWHRKMPGSKDA